MSGEQTLEKWIEDIVCVSFEKCADFNIYKVPESAQSNTLLLLFHLKSVGEISFPRKKDKSTTSKD